MRSSAGRPSPRSGLNFFLGAGLWGSPRRSLIGRVARRRIVGTDAAIGVVTTASFALGLALFGLYGQARRSTEAPCSAASSGSTRRTSRWSSAWRGHRGDRDPRLPAAAVLDLRSRGGRRVGPDALDRLDALLMVVLAVVILATMKVLGVALVAATLVIPPMVARMLTDSFARCCGCRPRSGRAGSPGWWPATTSTSRRARPIVLVGAALFAVVFAATGSCRSCVPPCARPGFTDADQPVWRVPAISRRRRRAPPGPCAGRCAGRRARPATRPPPRARPPQWWDRGAARVARGHG